MPSYNEQHYDDIHDDIHDGIYDAAQHTPLTLVLSAKPINCASPSVQELSKEDADVTRNQRKRKRNKPDKLKDYSNPDTARINKLDKEVSLRTKQVVKMDPLAGPDVKQVKSFVNYLKGKNRAKDKDCKTGTHGPKWFKEMYTMKTWLYDAVCVCKIFEHFQLMNILNL